MTDKKLLEAAARAAGMTDAAWNNGLSGMVTVFNQEPWNPLTDDGDALRLACKLRLRVNTDICFAEVPHEKQCAATRRAIVRAAAAIGSSHSAMSGAEIEQGETHAD